MSRDIETNNPRITIAADEIDTEHGPASHVYLLQYTTDAGNLATQIISFQRGPVGAAGVNGITNELLLQVLIDRLQSMQAGKYKCAENTYALMHTQVALEWLERRTEERKARGVEGINEV